jgi:glutathionyl-hydroquinone reductase
VEPGRYRLVVSRACPWANRAIIVRRLLGLEDALSMGVTGPTHDARSWTFDLDPGGRDPVLGIERLQEAYFARFPGHRRRTRRFPASPYGPVPKHVGLTTRGPNTATRALAAMQ